LKELEEETKEVPVKREVSITHPNSSSDLNEVIYKPKDIKRIRIALDQGWDLN
jgi:hypothetical protein